MSWNFTARPLTQLSLLKLMWCPFLLFLPDRALWSRNRCAGIIFEINDARALRLNQK
jgi:hypothetical protein